MRRSLSRIVTRTESLIGVVYAWIVTLLLALCGCSILLDRINTRTVAGQVFFATLLIAVILCQLISLHLAAAVLDDHDLPGAVSAAMHQRRCAKPLRPFVAAWWAAHFLTVAGIAVFIDSTDMPKITGWQDRLIANGIIAVCTFAGCFAANLYFLLMVTALFPRTPYAMAIWRWRVLVDIAVTAVAISIPYLKPIWAHIA